MLRVLGRVRGPSQPGEEAFAAVIEIAFRGSDHLDNWISNFDYSLEDTPLGAKAGKVHAGHLAAYLNVQDQILSKVFSDLHRLTQQGLSPAILVQATGHSLGGSLAMLCAYDLAGRGCSASCISFGAPKVGNRHFVDSYNSIVGRTLRFVNKFDPVPRMPPSDSDPVLNDADFLHQKLGAFAKRVGGEELGDYLHVCAPTQLDDGLASSIDHWKGLASTAISMFARPTSPSNTRGEVAASSTAMAQRKSQNNDAIVPHALHLYEKHIEERIAAAREESSGQKCRRQANLKQFQETPIGSLLAAIDQSSQQRPANRLAEVARLMADSSSQQRPANRLAQVARLLATKPSQ